MDTIVFFLYSLVSVFLIISPFSAVMTFVAFTNSAEVTEKKRLSKLAVLVACVIALLFASAGEVLLNIFNISVDILRIVCGALLLSVVYDALRFEEIIAKNKGADEHVNYRTGPMWLFPLAVPLLTGPGVLATVLTLAASAEMMEQKVLLLMAIAGAFAVTLLIFSFSNVIDRWMNQRRMYTFSRILATLLLALSVNMILTGLSGIGILNISGLESIQSYLDF